jgi:tetratricopeptide (TPR) repeat protein
MLIRALIWGILCVNLIGAPAQGATPDEIASQSIAVYLTGNINGAIIASDALIADYPSDFRGYLNKAIFTRQLALKTAKPALLDDALALLERARELVPDGANRAIVVGNIATTQMEKGDFAAAATALQESYMLTGRLFYKVRTAYAYARQGQSTKAINFVAELSVAEIKSADSSGNEGLTAYNMGLIYALSDQSAAAVKWLKVAEAVGPGLHDQGFRKDTDLDKIRRSKEFKSFLKQTRVARP